MVGWERGCRSDNETRIGTRTATGIMVWGSNSVTGQDWNQYRENGVRNWHRNDGIGTEGLGPLPRPHLSTTVPPHTTEWGLCAVGRMRAEWEHSWCHPPPPLQPPPKGPYGRRQRCNPLWSQQRHPSGHGGLGAMGEI